jgi:mRNA interferase RelE/StbE
MSDYTITFARSARKELQSLPIDVAGRLLKRIESLAINPRPIDSKKLTASSGLWRLRVGKYRVVYKIDESRNIIDISVIRHRKDVYR